MARKKINEPRRPKQRLPGDRKKRSGLVDDGDKTWLIRSKHQLIAIGILNHSSDRPWWASIPKVVPSPPANYFPCSSFEAEGRIYFGFLMRHHRDGFVESQVDSRKEYTEVAKAKSRRKV